VGNVPPTRRKARVAPKNSAQKSTKSSAKNPKPVQRTLVRPEGAKDWGLDFDARTISIKKVKAGKCSSATKVGIPIGKRILSINGIPVTSVTGLIKLFKTSEDRVVVKFSSV